MEAFSAMHKHVPEKHPLALALEATQPRRTDHKNNIDNENHTSHSAGGKEKKKTDKEEKGDPARTGANLGLSKMTFPLGGTPGSPASTIDYIESITPIKTPNQKSMKMEMAEATVVKTNKTAEVEISDSNH